MPYKIKNRLAGQWECSHTKVNVQIFTKRTVPLSNDSIVLSWPWVLGGSLPPRPLPSLWRWCDLPSPQSSADEPPPGPSDHTTEPPGAPETQNPRQWNIKLLHARLLSIDEPKLKPSYDIKLEKNTDRWQLGLISFDWDDGDATQLEQNFHDFVSWKTFGLSRS